MSLTSKITECRVSSVLNGDKKMYGKQFLFDGCDETCWSSDKGTPQKIDVVFDEEVKVSKLKIQFQGGFAARKMTLTAVENNDSDPSAESSDTTPLELFPHDTNQVQEFELEKPLLTKTLRIVLHSSYDFYGRLIVYHLDIRED